MAALIGTLVANEFGGISTLERTVLLFGCVSIGNDIVALVVFKGHRPLD